MFKIIHKSTFELNISVLYRLILTNTSLSSLQSIQWGMCTD